MDDRRELIDLYLLTLASGVLLADLADPYLPIAGIAAAWIVGRLIWKGLRLLVPRPNEDRR